MCLPTYRLRGRLAQVGMNHPRTGSPLRRARTSPRGSLHSPRSISTNSSWWISAARWWLGWWPPLCWTSGWITCEFSSKWSTIAVTVCFRWEVRMCWFGREIVWIEQAMTGHQKQLWPSQASFDNITLHILPIFTMLTHHTSCWHHCCNGFTLSFLADKTPIITPRNEPWGSAPCSQWSFAMDCAFPFIALRDGCMWWHLPLIAAASFTWLYLSPGEASDVFFFCDFLISSFVW